MSAGGPVLRGWTQEILQHASWRVSLLRAGFLQGWAADIAVGVSMFEVIEGRLPQVKTRMLVLDVDLPSHMRSSWSHHDVDDDLCIAAPYLSPREVAACNAAKGMGLDLVVCTESDREASLEHFGFLGIEVLLAGCGATSALHSRQLSLAGEVAELAYARGITPRSVAAIATRPVDLEFMMAFGIGYALADAGDEVVRAADVCFPARSAGGLVEAIHAVMRMASCGRELDDHHSSTRS